MRNKFVDTLMSLAETNSDLMLLTGDLGFGVLDDFAKQYPKQFLNVGVAEQNMTGVATGLALSGKIVFTYSIANFPTLRCIEQIRNDVCYHDADVKVAAIGGGFSYGALGMSHHATEDLAMLRSLPMTIVAPCDLNEVELATKAILEVPGACYLRVDKSCADTSHFASEDFVLGKARVLKRGRDCCLIATGGIMEEVISAAAKLESEGIDCTIVSMHTIKPIDKAFIREICASGQGIVTVEEHTVDGGLGSAIAEVCMDEGLRPAYFQRIGMCHGLSSVVGSQSYLRKHYQIDSLAIYETIMHFVANGTRKAI